MSALPLSCQHAVLLLAQQQLLLLHVMVSKFSTLSLSHPHVDKLMGVPLMLKEQLPPLVVISLMPGVRVLMITMEEMAHCSPLLWCADHLA